MLDKISLANAKILENKIIEYGFEKRENSYFYTKPILDGEFLLNVDITNDGVISQVIERETNERYSLYDVGGGGEFVGVMRAEYERLIADVKEKCTVKYVYKNEQSNQIIAYAKQKYGDQLEFLWEKFPKYSIIRNKSNNKWYLSLLVVMKKQLGLNQDGELEIINLMIEPTKLDGLVDGKRYFRAFHMNKKRWASIVLDGSVSLNEIFERIDDSYKLSLKNKVGK